MNRKARDLSCLSLESTPFNQSHSWFFSRNKTLPKSKLTGHREKQIQIRASSFRGCLPKAASTLRPTASSAKWWQLLTVWMPAFGPFRTDCYRHIQCKGLSLMSFENLPNPQTPQPHLKLPEYKVCSPQVRSLQHFSPWLHTIFRSLIVLCVPSWVPNTFLHHVIQFLIPKTPPFVVIIHMTSALLS